MNEFVFNDYGEFGLFLKINSEEVKGSTDLQPEKEKVDTCVKFFNAAKGGCKCNIKKRIASAEEAYETFVSSWFTDNEAAIPIMKEVLASESITFKKNSADEEPFYVI
jgi:hypothetical protein